MWVRVPLLRLMKITDTKNCPNCPGIYLIKNLINNKCYVGQSIKLRKRLFVHNKNIRNNADYPIYKAINKYGIDNFEYIVLEQIIDKLELQELKSKLDNLEKYYIEKYDSYKNGYNQTIGGDSGILEYVITDEQRNKISEHANPKLYNLPSPFKKEIYEYVITDLESNFLFRGNSNDCAQYFNIGEKYFKKIIKESPYKNKYYIHILNKEYKEDTVYHFINNKTGYTYTSIYYDKYNLYVNNFNDIINEQ